MSHIVDVLLITNLQERGVEKVQLWLFENSRPQLVEISDHAGGKNMQCEVWAAALNSFDIDAFAKAVASFKWQYPESVQLFIKDEYDERFTLRAGSAANFDNK